MPLRAVKAADGWCDAANDRNYNRAVRLPYPASAEHLSRDDGLYAMLAVIDYNLCPRVRGKGSAIFLHVAREGYLPTEGCVALSRAHLRLLLARLPRSSFISILK